MSTIACVRCGQQRVQLAAPPLPGDLGGRIYDSICQECWQEWLRYQTAIINHYALDLREAEARQLLTAETEKYLFGQPEA